VLVNFFQVKKYTPDSRIKAQGDHADEMETSLLLHLCPDLVDMKNAGTGERVPFAIPGLNQPGVWTPRPWSKSHPDTGSGDPNYATAEKGKAHFEDVCAAIAEVIIGVSSAKRGQMPYV
jgi:creatinine amidohydrolase